MASAADALHGGKRRHPDLHAAPGRALLEQRQQVLGGRLQVRPVGAPAPQPLSYVGELCGGEGSAACGHSGNATSGLR